MKKIKKEIRQADREKERNRIISELVADPLSCPYCKSIMLRRKGWRIGRTAQYVTTTLKCLNCDFVVDLHYRAWTGTIVKEAK